MLDKINPTQTQAWASLTSHYEKMKAMHLKDLFAANPDRFEKFSQRFENILIDYSKNIIDDKTWQLLLQLVEEVGLKAAIDAMFSGQAINETENRAVLHTALRNQSNTPMYCDGGGCNARRKFCIGSGRKVF